jgi:hypothetical protein
MDNVQNCDIIHRNVFYLKHKVSETGFCLRLQVEPIQLGTLELVSVSDPETESSSICWAKLSMFYLNTETGSYKGSWRSQFTSVNVHVKFISFAKYLATSEVFCNVPSVRVSISLKFLTTDRGTSYFM